MSDSLQSDLLKEALASLPRQRPSGRFTLEVLAELNRRGPRRGNSPRRLIWAAVLSLTLVSLIGLGRGYQRQQAAERAYRVQVEELRSRYQELLDEVATVRQEVSTPKSRVYLGGDERVDLVLDLSQAPTYRTHQQDRRDVRPAALEQ